MEIMNEMKISIDGEVSDYKGYLCKTENEAISLVHVRLIEELTGFKVEYINKHNLNIVTEEETMDLLVGKTIAIDEGHGGKDAGAVDEIEESKGDYIRTLEKTLNDKVGNKVIDKLKKLGAKLVITRKNDETVSLKARTDLANKERADIFVSIHFNAGSSQANGIETFKYRNTINPISHKLAENVHKQLIEATNFTDRGVKTSGFYVIRYTNMPAILVELGFITNTEEEKIINTDEFQEKVAHAIVVGILDTI